MVWDSKAPYKPESKKIVWEVAPYLRGTGIDIGAGSFKVLPHAISVDNGVDCQLFGMQFKPDLQVKDASQLHLFNSCSMDWVYSSHLLEHLEDPLKALKEWWRVLRVGGRMVLYLPHEDLYPKVGEPGANPDHKHNLNEGKVLTWMKQVGSKYGWDLEVCDKRNQDDEYSFLMVFRKTVAPIHDETWLCSKPEKSVCVVRYGAYGDLMMASSVFKGLKDQGYHVTVFASPPGADVIKEDPNIDKIVLFDKDQVPNADLGAFWAWQAKKFDKFVNLSESVEGTFLALPGRTQHTWAPAMRHKHLNVNYLEHHHELAEIPHTPQVKFYPTDTEIRTAKDRRSKMGKHVVMWSLAGSSVHKTWAGMDNIIASILVNYPDTDVVLVGGPEGQILEQGWEQEPRVHRTCSKWSIRETLSFLELCDVVIGPETGVLNAASCLQAPAKVVFLSHSSVENLTRDWPNTISLWGKKTNCPGRGNDAAPACHQMHYGWGNCKQDATSGTAQCQVDITVEEVWEHVDWLLQAVIHNKQKVA